MAFEFMFPPEIVQEFIIRINEDPKRLKNLLSCSLVSKLWCDLTRPLLYSRVVVAVGVDDATRASFFIRTLQGLPYIRFYIRSFILAMPDKPTGSLLSVLSCIGELPSLRSLQISSVFSDMREYPNLEDNISRVLDSRCLTRLVLSQLRSFPLESLRDCVALQHLTLKETTFSVLDPDARPVEPQQEERPIIKTLIALFRDQDESDIFATLCSPQSPVDLSQLETFIGLDRYGSTESYVNHCYLISKVSHSLKTVLIDPPTPCIIPNLQDPLGSLKPQELQTMSDITLSLLQRPNQVDALPWAIALLSGLPNPEALQQLTLLCDLEEHDDNNFTFHSRGWSDLNTTLLHFPNLRHVHLKCYDEPRHKVAEGLVSWLHSTLSAMVDRGILLVECFPDLTYVESMERQLMLSDDHEEN